MTDRTTPPTGSKAALDLGCTCAVMDNHYGAGVAGDGDRRGWWISGDCPLHGRGAAKEEGGDRP